ncbi:ankyrin repeat domain-containing protein, partial [Thiotrichales bacterium 19S9-12]|nr:ankyrin repeat domain-containing protein [Thiotrichales bacterium 19S9-12]
MPPINPKVTAKFESIQEKEVKQPRDKDYRKIYNGKSPVYYPGNTGLAYEQIKQLIAAIINLNPQAMEKLKTFQGRLCLNPPNDEATCTSLLLETKEKLEKILLSYPDLIKRADASMFQDLTVDACFEGACVNAGILADRLLVGASFNHVMTDIKKDVIKDTLKEHLKENEIFIGEAWDVHVTSYLYNLFAEQYGLKKISDKYVDGGSAKHILDAKFATNNSRVKFYDSLTEKIQNRVGVLDLASIYANKVSLLENLDDNDALVRELGLVLPTGWRIFNFFSNTFNVQLQSIKQALAYSFHEYNPNHKKSKENSYLFKVLVANLVLKMSDILENNINITAIADDQPFIIQTEFSTFIAKYDETICSYYLEVVSPENINDVFLTMYDEKNRKCNKKIINQLDPILLFKLAIDHGSLNLAQLLVNEGFVKLEDQKIQQYLEQDILIRYFITGEERHLNAQNKDKETPLHIAVRKNNQDAINLLLEKGANRDIADKNGNTALHLELQKENPNLDRIAALVSQNNIDIRNKWLETPLHIAVRKNNQGAINRLLEKGANQDIADKNGNTALHLELQKENPNLDRIAALVSQNNIDIRNKWLETPLHIAVRK